MGKRKIRMSMALVLALVLCFSITSCAASSAGGDPYEEKADALNKLGLFLGTENGYELESVATRLHGAVMMVRLLGMEERATADRPSHPFKDVADWASPYVGYLYQNGITMGISGSEFGTGDISAVQFCTFALRALGYSDSSGDFEWDKSLEKARAIGMIDGGEFEELSAGKFRRAQMVLIAYRSMTQEMKDKIHGGASLLKVLMRDGAVDVIGISASGDSDFFEAVKAVNGNFPIEDASGMVAGWSGEWSLSGETSSVKIYGITTEGFSFELSSSSGDVGFEYYGFADFTGRDSAECIFYPAGWSSPITLGFSLGSGRLKVSLSGTSWMNKVCGGEVPVEGNYSR